MDGCRRYEPYALCGAMAATDMEHVHILCELTDTSTVKSSLLCVSGWMRQIEAMYLCEWMNASERRHVLCVGVPHIQHMCSGWTDGWMPKIWEICSVWIDGFRRSGTRTLIGSMATTNYRSYTLFGWMAPTDMGPVL